MILQHTEPGVVSAMIQVDDVTAYMDIKSPGPSTEIKPDNVIQVRSVSNEPWFSIKVIRIEDNTIVGQRLLAITELFLPVILCAACRKQTDNGATIQYRSTGGWSPAWEGYVCEHVAQIPTDEFPKRLAIHYGKKVMA